MSKSLAELRAEPKPSRPEVAYKLCLDQALLAEAQRLRSEQEDLAAEIAASGGAADNPKPARNYEPKAARLKQVQAELGSLWDKMREVEGELTLRAIDGGEWQRFKDAHPAREGNVSDEQTCYGYCNTADLMADLGRFVIAWEGEELASADWAGWLSAKVAPADLRDLCMTVVTMHETRVSVPKSPSVSSETRENATS